ncbi:hypothetical protein BU16DRAFT_543299 [Lophium mytilinum]|uniref:Uncharacterized protein n=1 Tax=Lophium mytilinum TaxID=390894 RepID=A0A6A6QFS5_9PEZI|nr:hypothetical protein BU16DRAFT_543299 [Lophium mytilinum]
MSRRRALGGLQNPGHVSSVRRGTRGITSSIIVGTSDQRPAPLHPRTPRPKQTTSLPTQIAVSPQRGPPTVASERQTAMRSCSSRDHFLAVACGSEEKASPFSRSPTKPANQHGRRARVAVSPSRSRPARDSPPAALRPLSMSRRGGLAFAALPASSRDEKSEQTGSWPDGRNGLIPTSILGFVSANQRAFLEASLASSSPVIVGDLGMLLRLCDLPDNQIAGTCGDQDDKYRDSRTDPGRASPAWECRRLLSRGEGRPSADIVIMKHGKHFGPSALPTAIHAHGMACTSLALYHDSAGARQAAPLSSITTFRRRCVLQSRRRAVIDRPRCASRVPQTGVDPAFRGCSGSNPEDPKRPGPGMLLGLLHFSHRRAGPWIFSTRPPLCIPEAHSHLLRARKKNSPPLAFPSSCGETETRVTRSYACIFNDSPPATANGLDGDWNRVMSRTPAASTHPRQETPSYHASTPARSETEPLHQSVGKWRLVTGVSLSTPRDILDSRVVYTTPRIA